MYVACVLLFERKRRHTRWNCDWSSDVCSSDLPLGPSNVVLVRLLPELSDGPSVEIHVLFVNSVVFKNVLFWIRKFVSSNAESFPTAVLLTKVLLKLPPFNANPTPVASIPSPRLFVTTLPFPPMAIAPP